MKTGESLKIIELNKICQSLRVVENYMQKVPDGYLFLSNCWIENGSESVVKNGPHPRMTYFKISKANMDNAEKYTPGKIVFNKFRDFPTKSYDLVYLTKAKVKKELRILDVQEQGLVPKGRVLDEKTGNEILLAFVHQHNRTMFMSYLIHGEQSGANKFEMHHMYRDENGKNHQFFNFKI
jgi:hypothetical protein